ncbi:MAG: phosphate propanoyltransferase [Clostridia bacterium]|nr:phosphate propanoyltransferase [Clostridia bacterium]MCQ2479074.1 phosphate propanoyltransferase [Clostridia bacterium]
MNENEIRAIVSRVLADMAGEKKEIPIESSARHVHLTKEAVEALFGKGAVLTKKRDLSQPGEFLSEQRLKLVTAKGEIANVAVLGPERKAVQVELSMTDCRSLGIKAPVNLSGDLNGAGSVYLVSENAVYDAKQSVIVAQNHIHMTPADAEYYGVKDSQSVKVTASTARPVTFDNVVIRVSPKFALAMHIDFDEANACCLGKDSTGKLSL